MCCTCVEGGGVVRVDERGGLRSFGRYVNKTTGGTNQRVIHKAIWPESNENQLGGWLRYISVKAVINYPRGGD